MRKKPKEVLLSLGKINKMHTLLALMYLTIDRHGLDDKLSKEIDSLYDSFMASADAFIEDDSKKKE